MMLLRQGRETRRESQVEEAGTYVTDDESIGLSLCQVSLTLPIPNQEDFKLLQKDVHCCPSDR